MRCSACVCRMLKRNATSNVIKMWKLLQDARLTVKLQKNSAQHRATFTLFQFPPCLLRNSSSKKLRFSPTWPHSKGTQNLRKKTDKEGLDEDGDLLRHSRQSISYTNQKFHIFTRSIIIFSERISSFSFLKSSQKPHKPVPICSPVFAIVVPYNHITNPLQTKRRPLYLKTQSVRSCKHFSSRL
jgi:hypothetical protein